MPRPSPATGTRYGVEPDCPIIPNAGISSPDAAPPNAGCPPGHHGSNKEPTSLLGFVTSPSPPRLPFCVCASQWMLSSSRRRRLFSSVTRLRRRRRSTMAATISAMAVAIPSDTPIPSASVRLGSRGPPSWSVTSWPGLGCNGRSQLLAAGSGRRRRGETTRAAEVDRLPATGSRP